MSDEQVKEILGKLTIAQVEELARHMLAHEATNPDSPWTSRYYVGVHVTLMGALGERAKQFNYDLHQAFFYKSVGSDDKAARLCVFLTEYYNLQHRRTSMKIHVTDAKVILLEKQADDVFGISEAHRRVILLADKPIQVNPNCINVNKPPKLRDAEGLAHLLSLRLRFSQDDIIEKVAEQLNEGTLRYLIWGDHFYDLDFDEPSEILACAHPLHKEPRYLRIKCAADEDYVLYRKPESNVVWRLHFNGFIEKHEELPVIPAPEEDEV